LTVGFFFASEDKPVQSQLGSDMSKYRFDGADAFARGHWGRKPDIQLL